ncbi:PREDICTED: aspartate and glycine-rich protein-like [Tarenaya hassleriana]|uniref:aspartate and glycine-rich protein-like n=1 Tax=Tarenaya hassleriana TaxID=28532 RepID=UPI00053C12A0|nr:PREDICTED: aspartate and glycine-rich protein-like [Tarenaya hassleriana]
MAHLDSLLGLLFMMMPPFDLNQTADPAGNRPDKGKGVLGDPIDLEGGGSGGGGDSGSGSGGAKDKGKAIAIDDGTEQKGNYFDRMDIDDFDLEEYDDDDIDYDEETSSDDDDDDDDELDDDDYDYGFLEDYAEVDAEKKDKEMQDSHESQTPPKPEGGDA